MVISLEELEKAPVSDLPLKTQIDAWYDGTKCISDFANEVMVPLLKGLLSPSQYELAIRETYFRMHLLLKSIVALNRLEHFQSVAAATRSLFELEMDIQILFNNTTGDATEKYHAYPEIERYRVAEGLIAFSKKNPDALKMDISHQQTFHADSARQQRMAKLIRTNKKGKLQHPEHWTDKNVRDRAIDLKIEAQYIEAYPLLSWYIHAGASGTAGMTQQGLESCFALCHSLTQRIFINATSICAKATKISDAIDYFDKWVQGISLKTGELIALEQIKLLEEAKKKTS